MNDIEKLDNVTWYGHCVIHVMTAINELPEEAKLVFPVSSIGGFALLLVASGDAHPRQKQLAVFGPTQMRNARQD
jgi:hypothetical protein